MNKIKYLGAIGLLSFSLCFTSCNEDITNEEISESIDRMEERIVALEILQENIDNLVSLLNASAKGYLIASVSEDESGNITISFADGSNIVLRNTAVGTAPIVGVKADEEGKLFWTVNGEFIIVSGHKVPAQPVYNVPQFKFENNKWSYSFDGTVWTDVPGGDFSNNKFTYTESGDSYIFTIGDDTDIRVGKYEEFGVTLSVGGEELSTPITVEDNTENVVIIYDITGVNDIYSCLITAVAPNGFTATVSDIDRTITLTKGEGSWNNSVFTIIIGDGDQRTVVRKITFKVSA